MWPSGHSQCVYVMGCEVTISVYTVSLFHLSQPLFCFWSALYLSADRLIEDRPNHGQAPSAVNPDVVSSFVNTGQGEAL